MGSRRVPQTDRSFQCTHPGCNKQFSRAEHLQRHALNHQPGGDACPKCRAHFKRPDLLKRHMDRHLQKDLEAGGPGCGVLDTRKRSWKAPDGSVVEKRPRTHIDPETQVPSPESEPSVPETVYWTQGSHPQSDLHWPQPQFGLEGNAALGFEPVSQIEYDIGASLTQSDQAAIDPWTDSIDTNLDPSLLGGTMLDVAQLDFDRIFQPDTASSFNMPYTGPVDYSWLFDFKGNQTFFNTQFDLGSSNPDPLSAIPPASISNSQHSASVSESLNMQPPAFQSGRPTRHSSQVNRKTGRRGGKAVTGSNESSDPSSSIEIDRPFSLLSENPPIPRIDEQIREKLLQLVEATNPSLPSSFSIWEEPLLSVNTLQEYLNLYFTRFNTVYPLIHMPTFDIHHVEPLLLLSVVLLGATYSSNAAHQLAIRMHDVMRPSIFAHTGFSPRPELWILQTILLVECFGKSRAGQKQHDMSHLFHGLLINLIRRSDCQSVRPVGPPSGPTDHGKALEDAWFRWAIAEQKKRLALLCFMWDTQHAVLFCQSLCLSAFELRLELPSSQRIWEAADPLSWAAAWRSTPSPSGHFFLLAMKSYLTPSVPRPPSLIGLSRVLLLHGLMSIAWDMQRRDQTALGVVSAGGNWRKILGSAYEAWKSDFDTYTLDRLPRSEGEAQRNEHLAFATAYTALYHSAQALLNMEFLDVQIYAGARSILGRPVQQKDYRRSARNVKHWISPNREVRDPVKDGRPNDFERPTPWGENAASTAAYHAARILWDRTTILTVPHTMSLFHIPWCLYLATLTCWAFHHASPIRGRTVPSGSGGDESSDESDEMVWDPRGEMEALVASMAEKGNHEQEKVSGVNQRRQTNGLVWTMAEMLKDVRWEIVQIGVVVLRGLVPQRLINLYDDPDGLT